MKVYSIFSGSALIGAALLSSSLIFSARTLSAEPLLSQDPKTKSTTADAIAPVALEDELPSRGHIGERIAADPRVLPLGSRVRLETGAYSGEYLVADTGSMVRGRRIDIWMPSSREAMRFGRRPVKLTVLSLGGKKRTTTAKRNTNH